MPDFRAFTDLARRRERWIGSEFDAGPADVFIGAPLKVYLGRFLDGSAGAILSQQPAHLQRDVIFLTVAHSLKPVITMATPRRPGPSGVLSSHASRFRVLRNIPLFATFLFHTWPWYATFVDGAVHIGRLRSTVVTENIFRQTWMFLELGDLTPLMIDLHLLPGGLPESQCTKKEIRGKAPGLSGILYAQCPPPRVSRECC